MGSMRACSPVSLDDKGTTASYELSFKMPAAAKQSKIQASWLPSSAALSPSTSAFSSPARQDAQTVQAVTPQPHMRTPQHSAVATVKHELQEERRKLQALTRMNQESLTKMTEYKERYRGLKAAMNDKDKQLDLAKRTIERLSGQCNAVEAGMATDKAYTRKLEAKLSASRNISDLHARCSQYKLKLRELAQELEEAESRTASVQELADVRSDEIGTLRQALHLKAHDLSKQAGTDIHSRLLYAVAKSREEGVALAVQLAECKERTRQAEDAADDAHNAAQASREQLEEAQAELQHMQQKVVESVANCRRYEAGAQDIREEVQTMQRQVQVLAEEKADLVRSLQAEQLQSRQHQTQAGALQQQVQNLQKQRQQEAATAMASTEHVHREMQNHCTNLQAQLDAYKEKMEREREAASSSLARERARAAAAEEATDSSSTRYEARKRQLEHDLDNTHSEVQSLSQVNQRLQDSLQATTKAHQAERAKRENLHKQVLSLEASLSAVHSEHSQSDSSLKGRMQELLSELHSTLQERNMYKSKWQQLLSQHSSSQTTVERLQRDMMQQSTAYADLQKVNRALESRLLGHRSASPTTAAMPLYKPDPALHHSPHVATTAERTIDNSNSQGHFWRRQPVSDSPVRNSPYPHARAAVRQHDTGCPGSPSDADAERFPDWNNSTSHLDSLLAAHQHSISPGKSSAAQQGTAAAIPAGTSRAKLSSEDIMTRLTRSPEHASAGYAYTTQGTPAYQPAESSGFQSPPDTDAGDATLPTGELRTALFGSANAQQHTDSKAQQQPAAARLSAAMQHGAEWHSPSEGLDKPVQNSSELVFSHLHRQQGNVNSHHSQDPVHQEAPLWHNARPWSASYPHAGSAKTFSLHTNPLAEHAFEPSFAEGAGAFAQQQGTASKAVSEQQKFAAPGRPVTGDKVKGHTTASDLPFSLADLASMDPNNL